MEWKNVELCVSSLDCPFNLHASLTPHNTPHTLQSCHLDLSVTSLDILSYSVMMTCIRLWTSTKYFPSRGRLRRSWRRGRRRMRGGRRPRSSRGSSPSPRPQLLRKWVNWLRNLSHFSSLTLIYFHFHFSFLLWIGREFERLFSGSDRRTLSWPASDQSLPYRQDHRRGDDSNVWPSD